jgi:hypothetical protein
MAVLRGPAWLGRFTLSISRTSGLKRGLRLCDDLFAPRGAVSEQRRAGLTIHNTCLSCQSARGIDTRSVPSLGSSVPRGILLACTAVGICRVAHVLGVWALASPPRLPRFGGRA